MKISKKHLSYLIDSNKCFEHRGADVIFEHQNRLYRTDLKDDTEDFVECVEVYGKIVEVMQYFDVERPTT